MTQDDARDGEAAVDWVARLRDPAFTDWDAFTAWLEADPRRNALYERAALADRDLGEMLAATPPPIPAPSNDNPARARRFASRRLAGWSVAAAAVLLAVTAYPLLNRGDPGYDVTTAAGEQRNVVLADGTRIAMNGGTHLTLHARDTRLASLIGGEATFTVVHDAANPFTVQIGDDRVQDVGTVFNVARTGEASEIAVAEGTVLYNPATEAVTLTAGQTLRITPGIAQLVRGTTVTDTVGAWRQGRLVYHGAAIGRVAADVSRYLGISVVPDAAIAGRTFNGVIVLDHDPKRLLAHLAPLLDVVARPSEQGWRLTPRARETR